MYGMTRATMTLLGAAAAGLLLWLASQTDADGTAGYWTWLGLLASAGLVLALSQLLGGWTKWGWPRLSIPVFALGFLPALVAGGLVLLYAQPDGGSGSGLAADFGLEGLGDDLTGVLPAIAFGLGLLFGFTFDTTGPRRVVREVETAEERRADYDRRVADEPVTADRNGTRRPDEAPAVAAPVARDRDGDGVDDGAEASPSARRDD
jgi:hypothetical protein